MTTTQKIAELKSLSEQNDKNTFQRVKLATEILDDRDWVAQAYEGDEDLAVKAIEDNYFRGISGYVSLYTLREVYRMFPLEEAWAEYHYDICAMETKWGVARKAEDEQSAKPKPRRASLREMDALREENAEAKTSLEESRQIASSRESEVEQLQARVKELEAENHRLSGAIEELEKMFAGQPAA